MNVCVADIVSRTELIRVLMAGTIANEVIGYWQFLGLEGRMVG